MFPVVPHCSSTESVVPNRALWCPWQTPQSAFRSAKSVAAPKEKGPLRVEAALLFL
jgi:hypothetical protein